MSSTSPGRRHSRAIYRRRRVVLLIGLLVVIGLTWLFIAQPWSGSATPPPVDPTVSAPPAGVSPTAREPEPVVSSASPEPTAGQSAGAAACTRAIVNVEAIASQSAYAADAQPAFSIRLTNTGAQPCTLNVGTSAQTFTVTSGTDIWWRSTDCQQEPSDMFVTLAAGQSVTSAQPLTWDRTRSSVSTCESGDRQRAPGGGASYHLAVQVGGIASTQSAQFLLN